MQKIQISEIFADTGDPNPKKKNKFRFYENVRIGFLMYTPKDIANNSIKVYIDLAYINLNNNIIQHFKQVKTYETKWADKWVYNWITLGPNPIKDYGWIKLQVFADVLDRDDTACSSELLIKVTPGPG